MTGRRAVGELNCFAVGNLWLFEVNQLRCACGCMQQCRNTLWSEIKTEEMEEGAKGFVKEVKGLPKQVGMKGHGNCIGCHLAAAPFVSGSVACLLHDRVIQLNTYDLHV